MLILNDCHISANRSGGTTPQSQAQLRDYLRDSLRDLLKQHKGEHVVINGDFFDSFQVETSELIKSYQILVEHMATGSLTMIMGNHDASAKADKVSSFHLLCHFLKEAASESYFRMIDHNDGFCKVMGNTYAISHCMNQSLFDLEIEKAANVMATGLYLLLHANFKNGHAESSDHSLNVSDDQIGALMKAGWHVVFGHEHIGAEFRSGRVIVVGNNFPSSISDCIGDPDKNALIIDGNGHRYVQTWTSDAYAEVDWKEVVLLPPPGERLKFIRVVGDATALESADVIKCISALRQRHSAFIISNAVKVEGHSMVSDMTEQSVEDIKAFDVLSAIYENLTPEETAAVKGLLT